MSLITRCPACGTMFKVVPDQLRISEGWVRCGHCAEVFDASANLQARPEPVHTPAPPAAAAPGESAPAKPNEAIEPVADANGFLSSIHTEIDEELAVEPLDPAEFEAHVRALRESPLDEPFELLRPSADVASSSEPASRESNHSVPAEAEPELDDLSFVRKARRKAFWARSSVRAGLVLATLVLSALLVLQVALQDKDRLAAAVPGLRPALSRLCEPLHCRIGPVHQIESIAIDTSGFTLLRGDTYRLNVTLKNRAPIEVAMPALELTLTDSQDQEVVRRVLMPAEWSPGAAAIGAGAEWSRSLPIAVAATALPSRIAGYRLIAFYP
jgi:predicted Zn finger-like uncharacterized protein